MAQAKRVRAQYASSTLKLTAAGAAGLSFAAFAVGEAAAQPRQQAPIVYAKATPSALSGPGAGSNAAAFSGGSIDYRYIETPRPVQAPPAPAPAPAAAMQHAAPQEYYAPRQYAHTQPNNAAISPYAAPARAPAAVSVPPQHPQRAQHVASAKPRPVALSQDAPPGFAKQKIGAPYQIAGRWYVPTVEPDYDEVGIASWYGPKFHGRPTAMGETFDMNAMTAAHPTLPIPSLVRVTNLENGRTAVVRLNDRGPFVDDRMIDLSRKAAQVLGFEGAGTAKVRVQYMGFAPEAPNSLPPEYAHQDHNASRAAPRSPASTQPRPSAGLTAAHYLQAGAFADIGNAHTLRRQLSSFGDVAIRETRINGTDYFKVMIGPWSSPAAADNAKRNLARAGFQSVVVRAR